MAKTWKFNGVQSIVVKDQIDYGQLIGLKP